MYPSAQLHCNGEIVPVRFMDVLKKQDMLSPLITTSDKRAGNPSSRSYETARSGSSSRNMVVMFGPRRAISILPRDVIMLLYKTINNFFEKKQNRPTRKERNDRFGSEMGDFGIAVKKLLFALSPSSVGQNTNSGMLV